MRFYQQQAEGGGGAQGDQATVAVPIDCTAVVDSRPYTVWLMEFDPLPDRNGTRAVLQDGIRSRLQNLFDRVAQNPRSHVRRITVQWTPDVTQECIDDDEIILYFTYWYRQPRTRVPSRETDSPVGRALRAAQVNASVNQDTRRVEHEAWLLGNIPDAEGYTYPRSPFACSEIYVDRVNWPYPDEANYADRIRSVMAPTFGNLAFHEAMHNKIEGGGGPDVHSIPGVVLGRDQPPLTAADDASIEDIRYTAQYLRARVIQFRTSPRAATAPASAAP